MPKQVKKKDSRIFEAAAMILTGIILFGSIFSAVQNKLSAASLQRALAHEDLNESVQTIMPPCLTEAYYEVDIILLENGIHMIRYRNKNKPEESHIRFVSIRFKDSEEPFDNTGEIDKMADAVLAGITKPNMSQREVAGAIYHWIRGNITYTANANDSDWIQAAYDGFMKRRGDCFVFYAAAKHLLTRAGIENLSIVHILGTHYWNMVWIDGDWYHFDTTPRHTGGDFFLLTDAALVAYSEENGGSHVWDSSLYPAATGMKPHQEEQNFE